MMHILLTLRTHVSAICRTKASIPLDLFFSVYSPFIDDMIFPFEPAFICMHRGFPLATGGFFS